MRPLLVSHPHVAAVSVETAAALERRHLLAGYFTGVSAVRGSVSGAVLGALARRRPVVANRLVSGIRSDALRSLWAVELTARLAGRAARAAGASSWRSYDALFVGHDTAVSMLPWPSLAGGVYAYEDGALRTFRRASRAGLARVLDLPTPWWTSAERLWREESARWPGAMGPAPHEEPAWKRKRKCEELALADVVSVASGFTRSSALEAAGERPVVVTPYGFPVERFAARAQPPKGTFTVLAVGNQDLRKGTPYLLEAWRLANIKDATLRLVGGMRLTRAFLGRYAGLFEHVPWMPRANLEQVYQQADLVAFPTLGDGFGLVIQEAMCCGTPVLTTRCGGGPECIEDGETGLLVPDRSVEALVEALRWASLNRDRLSELGQAARRRAESWTWSDAGRCLVDGLVDALG
jgi:glycosyltransferase involved in cell wall biosynthesis